MILKSVKTSSKGIGLFLLLIGGMFVLSACSITTTSSNRSNGIDSSVFLSMDGGTSWREAVNMASPNEPRNIRPINVNTMVIDPQDHLAVYLASHNDGLFYTYNVFQRGWTKAEGLPGGLINDVKIDPRNKCVIYAASLNRLYKSTDCSRSFEQVFFENNLEVHVRSIAVDHYNPNNVYIGTSRGEVIKSMDGGETWRTIHRLDNGVKQLILSPADSRLAFVATDRNRIFSFNVNSIAATSDPEARERSYDITNFTDLNPVLDDYDLGRTFRDFVVSGDGKIFIATNSALLRSSDNGITWERINILQPENDAFINALAVNPQNSENIFYVTNTTFFRSNDGGTTWSTKKLPTSSRAGNELLVDYENPNYIYLGTVKLK